MDARDWNRIIAGLPVSHLLQTWEWGQIKAAYGWKVLPQTWTDGRGTHQAAALVLERSPGLKGLFRVLYVPRGPLLDWADDARRKQVLDGLETLVRERKAMLIKIDPEVVIETGFPGQAEARPDPLGQKIRRDLQQRGWRFSVEQVQFRNTFWVDLTAPPEEWLARMKQKTRYNIRLAERKGVSIRAGTLDDLPMLYRMYAETSIRDGFVIRPENYYRRIWQTFMERQMAQILIAEVQGEAVAGLVLFHFGKTAYYLYGMSRQAHREKMPNHLLQWEAMKRARAAGCTRYDLWGAPDHFQETDPMWGVYRFKEGLGGTVVQTLGAWDYVCNFALYFLYTRIAPAILELMRRRGKARTRQEVSP